MSSWRSVNSLVTVPCCLAGALDAVDVSVDLMSSCGTAMRRVLVRCSNTFLLLGDIPILRWRRCLLLMPVW